MYIVIYFHAVYILFYLETLHYPWITGGQNRSTERAIIELTPINRLTKAIDNGEFTIGIFLDLSKAFYTINYKILTQKQEHYDIRGVAQL